MKKIHAIRIFLPLLLITVLSCPETLSAQDSPSKESKAKKSFSDRVFYGGNLGLNIGRNTFIQLNPLIGYKVTEKYSVGLGPNYTYFGNEQFEEHIFGGSIFNRLIIYEGVFAQAEFEQLSITRQIKGVEGRFKSNFPALLVGGGIRRDLGGNTGLVLMVQYDLLQDENSIYGDDLIVRGGVNVGF